MPYYFTELGRGMVLIGDHPMAFPHGSNPQKPWAYEKAKNKAAVPTIGRVVYYHVPGMDQPMAAIVASVIGDYTINIGFLSPDGVGGSAREVPHIDQRPNDITPYWDWMDFQKGQAAKTEELQRALDTKTKGVGIASGQGPAAASGQGAAGAVEGSK